MQKLLRFVLMCGSIVAIGSLVSVFFIKKEALAFDIQLLEKKENIVPILVIGSGCAGYSAALYGARGNVKTVVIEGLQPGGQLSGTTKVENYPGLIDQLGPDIVHAVQKQGEIFGAERIVYVAVKSINCSTWPFLVETDDGMTIYALTIILATGASPLKLGVPGEEQFWGRGVTTCAICDAPFHKGNDVVVIGGGDSAIEEALQLSAYAKTITIVVRKGAMRAAPSMQDRLKSVDNISILYNSEVKAIIGNEEGVTSVEIYNNKTNEMSTKSVSGVFLAIGHTPNSALVKGSIALDSDGYIITKSKSQETNIPGIFAAGDVEDKVYRQAGVAAGSGIRAGLDALNFLQNIGFNASVAQKLESHYLNLKNPKKVVKPALEEVSSAQEFYALLKDKPVLVVDFYTKFCPSCNALLPTIELVAQQFGDKITCIKINADEVPELSQRYKISSVPALFLFKDGKLLDEAIGALPEQELMEFIQQAF